MPSYTGSSLTWWTEKIRLRQSNARSRDGGQNGEISGPWVYGHFDLKKYVEEV